MEHWDEIVTDRRLTLEVAEAHLERVVSQGPRTCSATYQVVTIGRLERAARRLRLGLRGLAGLWPRERAADVLAATAGGGGERRGERLSPPRMPPIRPRSFRARSPARRCSASACRSPSRCRSPRSSRASTASSRLISSRYPSMLRRLAAEAGSGRLRISPRELNCGAEPLLPEQAEIEAAFRRPLINLYAAAEVGVIARSYPGAAGLHLNEDIAVYELVDDDEPARSRRHPRAEAARHQRHQSRVPADPLRARR